MKDTFLPTPGEHGWRTFWNFSETRALIIRRIGHAVEWHELSRSEYEHWAKSLTVCLPHLEAICA